MKINTFNIIGVAILALGMGLIHKYISPSIAFGLLAFFTLTTNLKVER